MVVLEDLAERRFIPLAQAGEQEGFGRRVQAANS